MPCPYKSGDGYIELGSRYYPLPEIRRRQCRVPTNPVMVTSNWVHDHFGVGKRHCRVLHRPQGRWLYPIRCDFTRYPKSGDGSAVSLQFLYSYYSIFHTMPYDPQKHHRRSVRIKGYDYTQPGVYYITICTNERQCIFGEVIDGQMRLNLLGHLAHTCWLDIPNHFSRFQLDTFVIMPDHVHGLLAIVDNTPVRTQQRRVATPEQFGQPVRGSIPTAIRSYKSAVTRFIHRFCETTEVPVWQDGFHESIIRDEKTLNCKRQYIINNPQRWGDNPQKLEHQKNHPILLDSRF